VQTGSLSSTLLASGLQQLLADIYTGSIEPERAVQRQEATAAHGNIYDLAAHREHGQIPGDCLVLELPSLLSHVLLMIFVISHLS
jgi:hypothetical protein